MRRWLTIALGALVLAAMAAPAAWAGTQAVALQTTGAATTVPDGTTIQGAGTLLAVGRGTVQIDGSGVVTGQAAVADLVVRNAERVTIEGYGRKEVLPDGTVRYRGVRGEFKIVGNDFDFDLRGDGVKLRTSGHGVVRLAGVGRYWAKGVPMGAWPGLGHPMEY